MRNIRISALCALILVAIAATPHAAPAAPRSLQPPGTVGTTVGPGETATPTATATGETATPTATATGETTTATGETATATGETATPTSTSTSTATATATVTATATQTATPSPSPTVPPEPVAEELRGMVIRDPWYDCNRPAAGEPREPNKAAQRRMGEILGQAGVRWVRLEFFVTDDPDSLAQTYACYDYFINEVAPANNLQVLGLLGFGLVRDRDALDPNIGLISNTFLPISDQPYGGGVNVYMRDWLDRALAISQRYNGKNGFGRLAALEVLNEQNRMPPSGDGVPAGVAARLHTKFYRFFKFERREPGAAGEWRDTTPVLIGGLHPRGTGATFSPSDVEYLRQYFGFPPAGGAPIPQAPFQEFRTLRGRYPADGMAYHPYPAEIVEAASLAEIEREMDRIERRLTRVRSVLFELGGAHLPFWITEIGYDAGRSGQNNRGQAIFLATVFRLMEARDDVRTVFWFKYEDFPGNANAPNRWGVVRIPFTSSGSCEGGACYEPSGEPAEWRPSYRAFRELTWPTIEELFLPNL